MSTLYKVEILFALYPINKDIILHLTKNYF